MPPIRPKGEALPPWDRYWQPRSVTTRVVQGENALTIPNTPKKRPYSNSVGVFKRSMQALPVLGEWRKFGSVIEIDRCQSRGAFSGLPRP
jgi:hypothetical protein